MDLAFVDAESIATIGAASMLVLAITNTFARFFKSREVIVALIASFLIILYNTDFSEFVWHKEPLLMLFNTCVLFSASTGFNQSVYAVQKASNRRRDMFPTADKSFFKPWF